MDPHLDTSWCPVCDRQILPKRYTVPVPPLPPSNSPTTLIPATSPEKADDAPTTRRTKGGTIRQKGGGGLVHGTGRVKANGSIKRADPTQSVTPPQPTPAVPIKACTVIDQGPTPLYCSDECQLKDLNSVYGELDYNPDRHSPTMLPVPHNSLSNCDFRHAESDSRCGSSSVDLHSSSKIDPLPQSPISDMSPSMAALFNIYNWQVPPPAPVLSEASFSAPERLSYDTGIMMAARWIAAVFCPESPSKCSNGHNAPREPRKPIPGWTDGSNAWRAEVYSFVPPTKGNSVDRAETTAKAYGSFIASPHRSRGIYSTLGESTSRSLASTSDASSPLAKTPDMVSTEELCSKFSESFTRRSEHRANLYPSSYPRSGMATAPRRERSLVHPDAQGKLLVPDVKLMVRGGSSGSLSGREGSSVGERLRRRQDSARSEREPQAFSPPAAHGPVPTARKYSDDSLYPMMPLANPVQKRIERQIINGVEQDVEVEVVQPLKRLFRFAGEESPRDRQRLLRPS